MVFPDPGILYSMGCNSQWVIFLARICSWKGIHAVSNENSNVLCRYVRWITRLGLYTGGWKRNLNEEFDTGWHRSWSSSLWLSIALKIFVQTKDAHKYNPSGILRLGYATNTPGTAVTSLACSKCSTREISTLIFKKCRYE